MSLFEVPGWDVKTAPVREENHQVSKKRKRPATQSLHLETAEVNVKFMAKLANVASEKTSELKQPSNKAKSQARKRKEKRKQTVELTKGFSKPLPSTTWSDIASIKASTKKLKDEPESKPKKKVKTKDVADESPMEASPSNPITAPAKTQTSSSGLTALQRSMKDSLNGARFRLINENMYKTDSHEAHNMMREDPQVFDEYHVGFRHQVLSWPTNPVEHYISVFALYPPKTIIADLGCGDAALAKGLLPQGISVLSFDLVSDCKYVIEADVCDKIPLPGSEGSSKEKSMGEGQVVDVVVCALSLMGVNWLNCLREAWRILKTGGELHIAEVTSRFTDIEKFQNLLGSIGFRLKTKDDTKSSHFILFEFTKIARFDKTEKEWVKLVSKGAILKPCEYKRR